MLSCLRFKCFPTMGNQRRNFIPVDYLTAAMLQISKLDKGLEQGYNLVPELLEPPTTELQETFRMLEQAIRIFLEKFPCRTWLHYLQAQDNSDRVRPILPILDEQAFNGMCRWVMYTKMTKYETTILKRHMQSDPSLGRCAPLNIDVLKNFLTNL